MLIYDHLDRTNMKSAKRMKNTANSEQWVTVERVAVHLNVKPDTIYKWVERKKLPAHKLGRLWRFRTSEVDEWIKSGGSDRVGKKSKTPVNNRKRALIKR